LQKTIPGWMQDFIRFGVVGVIGFIVNVAVVYAVRGATGLYASGVIAWLVAASTTWWLNRSWTFKGRGDSAMHHQWLRFLAVSSLGFVLYYTAFSLLAAYFPLCHRQPVFAVLGGVFAGMVSNFTLSRKLVFK
jgi:putative flippase GtrA